MDIHSPAAKALAALCRTYLREPARFYADDAGVPVVEWSPPLSAAEQAILDDLKAMARLRITGLTLAEYQALKPTLAGLATYRDLASPTNAQSVAAIKGIIDVLRALVTG